MSDTVPPKFTNLRYYEQIFSGSFPTVDPLLYTSTDSLFIVVIERSIN